MWLHKSLKLHTCTHAHTHAHTHTHTHPFNGPLSGTTRVSRNQKGKTNLDFTEARDSEWQWHQLGHMQVCTSLQTDNHASTPPLRFLQTACPSCRPTNSVKALKVKKKFKTNATVNYIHSMTLTNNKSSVKHPASARNMLPAFAAECRHLQLLTDICCRCQLSAANPPATIAAVDQ